MENNNPGIFPCFSNGEFMVIPNGETLEVSSWLSCYPRIWSLMIVWSIYRICLFQMFVWTCLNYGYICSFTRYLSIYLPLHRCIKYSQSVGWGLARCPCKAWTAASCATRWGYHAQIGDVTWFDVEDLVMKWNWRPFFQDRIWMIESFNGAFTKCPLELLTNVS
jgi:hypothetical protein